MLFRILLNRYMSKMLYKKRFKMAQEGYFVHCHSAGVHEELLISSLNLKTLYQMLAALCSLTVCNYWLDKKLSSIHPRNLPMPRHLKKISKTENISPYSFVFNQYRVMNLYKTASLLKTSQMFLFCREMFIFQDLGKVILI